MQDAGRDILRQVRRVVIKVGSGVVTQKDGGLARAFFTHFARDIAWMRANHYEPLVVSSGAVACGIHQMGFSKKPHQIPAKQALAAIGQTHLVNAYEKYFRRHHIQTAQMLLTRDDIEHHHRFLNAKHTLAELLRLKVVPVINENDTVAVEEIRLGDNDQLSALVAHLAEAHLLILLTDIDAFYDRDPRTSRQAKRIPLVYKIDAKMLARASGTLSYKSIGGMATKLKAAQNASRQGIPTVVAAGAIKRIVYKILQGQDLGTLFLPAKRVLTP